MLFISLWSARIDLRNEIFILNIGEDILIKINESRCRKSVYISAILEHIEMFFISLWSARIDLRKETFILNIGEEIIIKINESRCMKSVYISAILEHIEMFFYLIMKWKDWSTKRDIYFERDWGNSDKNKWTIYYKITSLLNVSNFLAGSENVSWRGFRICQVKTTSDITMEQSKKTCRRIWEIGI